MYNTTSFGSSEISLSDDYSLPVDFVNKNRLSNSLPDPATTIKWAFSGPTIKIAEIEVVEQYSNPKDSKDPISVNKQKSNSLRPTICIKANHNYCCSCTEQKCEPINKELGRNHCTNTDFLLDSAGLLHLRSEHSPPENLSFRHPSPYYYGDLFQVVELDARDNQPNSYQKSASLDVPAKQKCKFDCSFKRNFSSDNEGLECESPSKSVAKLEQSDSGSCKSELQLNSFDALDKLTSVTNNVQTGVLSNCIITEWDYTLMPPHRLLSHDLPTVCTYLASNKEDNLESNLIPTEVSPTTATIQSISTRHKVRKLRRFRKVEIQSNQNKKLDLEDDFGKKLKKDTESYEEMSHQRQIYETAFDCKVSRSDDDSADLDKMTNHSLLISHMRNNFTTPLYSRASSSTESSKQSQQTLQQASLYAFRNCRRKVVVLRSKTSLSSRQKQLQNQNQRQLQQSFSQAVQHPSQIHNRQHNQSDTEINLPQNIESLHINSNNEKSNSSLISDSGCTRSSSSTAPLPTAFQNHESSVLNMRSTSNFPTQDKNSQDIKQKHSEDVQMPVLSKSYLKNRSSQSNDNTIFNIKNRPRSFIIESRKLILEFKNRSVKTVLDHRPRPRSLVRESEPVMEFKGRPHEAETSIQKTTHCQEEQQVNFLELNQHNNGTRRRSGYSSTESMTTSSSSSSMESLRSSTSEGNRSTSSSESRHSASLSSHSSDSENVSCFYHHCGSENNQTKHQNQFSLQNSTVQHNATTLHILSPISDKSSQEPASEKSDNNKNNNSQKTSPEKIKTHKSPVEEAELTGNLEANQINSTNRPNTTLSSSFKKRRAPQNKNFINMTLETSLAGDAEIQGSDSGISIESRASIKCNKLLTLQSFKTPQLIQLQTQQQLDSTSKLLNNEQELSDLPFDMPKLRRRRLLLQQDTTTSGSATSIDLKDLPFDMPKLRRRLRCTQSIESNTSQASSSHSIQNIETSPLFNKNGDSTKEKVSLSLNKDSCASSEAPSDITSSQQFNLKKPGSLNLDLSLELTAVSRSEDCIDVKLPLERQGWYHGSITRIEAESVLRLLREGSYLVRNSESTKQDYSLSLKSAKGFMHMRIQRNDELNAYILGQFSKPFNSIPEMVHHFSINRLPIRGAEHMCLLHPVIAQLL